MMNKRSFWTKSTGKENQESSEGEIDLCVGGDETSEILANQENKANQENQSSDRNQSESPNLFHQKMQSVKNIASKTTEAAIEKFGNFVNSDEEKFKIEEELNILKNQIKTINNKLVEIEEKKPERILSEIKFPENSNLSNEELANYIINSKDFIKNLLSLLNNDVHQNIDNFLNDKLSEIINKIKNIKLDEIEIEKDYLLKKQQIENELSSLNSQNNLLKNEILDNSNQLNEIRSSINNENNTLINIKNESTRLEQNLRELRDKYLLESKKIDSDLINYKDEAIKKIENDLSNYKTDEINKIDSDLNVEIDNLISIKIKELENVLNNVSPEIRNILLEKFKK